MSVNLTTTLGSIELPTPIIAASGSYGHSDELFDVVDTNAIGAITTKSLAPFESPGNISPRLSPVPTGMMNSVGLPGPEITKWASSEIPKIRKQPGRFIAAIWGHTAEHYVEAAKAVLENADAFVALEINIACPNTDRSGQLFAQNPNDTKEIVSLVKKEAENKLPITTKLTPAVTSIIDIAEAAIDGGSDMLTLFNTFLGLSIDPYTRKPTLGKGGGGYSGPGVFPLVQRGIHDVHKAFPEIPIIGTGGVSSGSDAATLMMCGASAVGVATAVFADPNAPIRIAEELNEFCEEIGVKNVTELIGVVE